MAKKSVTLRNEKRKKLSAQYYSVRQELKARVINFNLSDEERDAAQIKLQKLPRNSAPTRIRNRCQLTGRPRGVYSKYMISRICFREMAHQGLLPGVTKSSW